MLHSRDDGEHAAGQETAWIPARSIQFARHHGDVRRASRRDAAVAGRRAARWQWLCCAVSPDRHGRTPAPPPPGRSGRMVDAGDFKAAESAIADALQQPGLSSQQQQAYAFQRERMRRILLDFTPDEDGVKARRAQADPRPDRRRIREVERRRPVRAPGHRRPDAVLQPLAVQPVPAQRRGAGAPRPEAAADHRRPDGIAESRTSARSATPRWPRTAAACCRCGCA